MKTPLQCACGKLCKTRAGLAGHMRLAHPSDFASKYPAHEGEAKGGEAMSTENRRPMSTPDLEWLERAIQVWSRQPESVALLSEEIHSLAEHLLGNWLTIEDAQVRELVEAAKEAEAQLDVLRQLAGARQTPTQRRLDAALAPWQTRRDSAIIDESPSVSDGGP